MKTPIAFLFLLAGLLLSPAFTIAQNPGNGLPATDALGRKLPDSDEVGLPRKKFVGLFYWTWHTRFSYMPPYIPSEIIKQEPAAIYDFQAPIWPKEITSFFWGEPLFGFYRNTDAWVLRKHAEMLADAGVDVLIFDCTNGSLTWKESYMALCKVFTEARKDGIKTPQIAFMLAFGPQPGSLQAITEIYNDLYKPGIYRDLFFNWKGKPLIMAYPEMLVDVPDDLEKTRLHREIRDYFTFRPGQPVYNVGPTRPDHWGWLEIYPQHGFAPTETGTFEQVTVGVSQNWTAQNELSAMNMPGAFGRSYTAAEGHIRSAKAIDYGYNFQEQWNRALEIDPEFIFITGWNEWVAGRYDSWRGQENAFPDQYDQENSRDIEPMKGGHGDNYYYQMVDNIRRFKGVPTQEKASASQTIRIDGRFDEWNDIRPKYEAHKGNTLHRNSPGWGDLVYTNTSGRNDIVETKVARDKHNLYFYVACADTITPQTDPAWMRLFIDCDRNKTTGWEGYDFVVNRVTPGKKAILERNGGGWAWYKVGEIRFQVNGKQLELQIPKKLLGIDQEIDIEFKWSDNMQSEGDIFDFTLNGDAAPSGRFNYLYQVR